MLITSMSCFENMQRMKFRNRVFTNMDSDHKIYKEIFHQQGWMLITSMSCFENMQRMNFQTRCSKQGFHKHGFQTIKFIRRFFISRDDDYIDVMFREYAKNEFPDTVFET